MKKLLIAFLFIALTMSFTQCAEQSEGTKYGLLQKVSHKKFPNDHYKIQIAYDGGVTTQSSNGKSSSYSDTQDFTVTKQAADTLDQHVGDKVVFQYEDNGFEFGKPSKVLTSLKVK